jgi:hypothetical protein
MFEDDNSISSLKDIKIKIYFLLNIHSFLSMRGFFLGNCFFLKLVNSHVCLCLIPYLLKYMKIMHKNMR